MNGSGVHDRFPWRRAVVILSLVAVVFGGVVRFARMPDVFCQSPDELAEIMPGVRLHALPIGNLGAPVRYNFLQSMFYSQHGLGDVSFYYLASGLLSLVRLPVSEHYLYAVGAVTNLGLVIAAAVVGARLIGSATAGPIVATLVLVSPFFTFVSKTGWARLSWTPLLLLLVFLAQPKAMNARGVIWPAIYWLLAGFIALTDGFTMLPVLPVIGLLSVNGRLTDRLRQLARDRIFLGGMAAVALGIAFDLLIGFGAMRRGTTLTMMAYVMLKGGGGTLIPSWATLVMWANCVDRYFSVPGAWLVVAAACVLAVRDGLRGRMVGFVAAWWLLASAAVIRYAGGIPANVQSVPGWLNAYHLAIPSFLLVAWLFASVGEGRFAPTQRIAPSVRGAAAFMLLLALVVFLGHQAVIVAFASKNWYALGNQDLDLVHNRERPLSGCRTVKAAAFYIRSHQTDVPYVFHLSANVSLGHIAEFYDGLSYSRSSQPEDPNHLLDFGLEQTGRRTPPEAFYRPYGVRHFDYYVEFADDPDPFKIVTMNRLIAEGARVVCTITDEGRPIGRILSFRDEAPVELDYRAAAAAWDRRFGRASTLLQQPLTGTAYHFGYNWKPAE